MKKYLFVLAFMMATTSQANTPPWVHLDSISYAGSGCPAGTVYEDIRWDGSHIALYFDQYLAEAGPGIPRVETRQFCQISIDLNYPQGWSFTLASVGMRGYVSLERGMSAQQTSSYYFQGQSQTATFRTNWRGAIDEDYEIRDELGLSSLVWSPCGANRALNIRTQVRVSGSTNRSGLITLDTIYGAGGMHYGIKWRRCR